MSRLLLDLDSRLLPLAQKLIAQAQAAGIELVVITTLRSYHEQELAVQHGVSWTLKSMHLPQPPEGKSLAIDVCPHSLMSQKWWAPKSPLWWTLAQIGTGLGLRSGMDWHNVGLPPVGQERPAWDPSHYEFVVKEHFNHVDTVTVNPIT